MTAPDGPVQGAAYVPICALADIPVLGARVVERPAIRTATSRCSAPPPTACSRLLDRCPHKGGPLSQGIVFGERVACPLHNWTIELADGGDAVAPDVGCAQRFPVAIERRRRLRRPRRR